MEWNSESPQRAEPELRSRIRSIFEAALMVCFLFLFVGELPPDVNEVHYLTKARYVWDPTYCARDLFVTSPGAQPLFVALFGWMTSLWGFSAAAWIGRGIAWSFLAMGWLRLAHSLRLPWGWGLLSLALATGLNESLHMAGEWFVGGIEAKSIAYGFVAWGLAFLIEHRIGWALAALSMAIAFHPLVGGWFLLAMGLALIANRDGNNMKPTRTSLVLGGMMLVAAVVVSIIPLVQYDAEADAATRSQAHQLYVYTRLPHHLVPHAMRSIRVHRFAALVIVWSLATCLCRADARLKMVHWTALGTLVIALCGWGIDLMTWQHPAIGASILRLYWFRAADVGVAWSLALTLAASTHERIVKNTQRGPLALVAIVFLVACITLDQIVDRNQDLRPPADRQGAFGLNLKPEQRASCYLNWQNICDWIRTNTDRDALFLTPLKSQTFRWYSDRAEYVNWKDMPQNAVGILEWANRRREVDALEFPPDDRTVQIEQFLDFARSHGIDYVVVVRHGTTRFWAIPSLYQNDWFSLFKVEKTSQ
jgi:hypothetical protein